MGRLTREQGGALVVIGVLLLAMGIAIISLSAAILDHVKKTPPPHPHPHPRPHPPQTACPTPAPTAAPTMPEPILISCPSYALEPINPVPNMVSCLKCPQYGFVVNSTYYCFDANAGICVNGIIFTIGDLNPLVCLPTDLLPPSFKCRCLVSVFPSRPDLGLCCGFGTQVTEEGGVFSCTPLGGKRTVNSQAHS